MKTTIEITDALLAEAKAVAARDGVTLRALIEFGLRRALEDHERAKTFKLREVGFEGRGFTPEFRDASWEKIRDAIYEGHGA